jgi:hypothetical protein
VPVLRAPGAGARRGAARGPPDGTCAWCIATMPLADASRRRRRGRGRGRGRTPGQVLGVPRSSCWPPAAAGCRASVLIERAAAGGARRRRRWTAALADHRHRDAVLADAAAALSLGANGTPTVIVNGRALPGMVDADELETTITAEIARARRARVARGVAAGRRLRDHRPGRGSHGAGRSAGAGARRRGCGSSRARSAPARGGVRAQPRRGRPRRTRRGRRGLPRDRRHLRDPRLRAEEAVHLRRALRAGLRGRGRLRLDGRPAEFSWRELMAAKDREIARLEGIYRNLLAQSKVETIDGRATIVDPHTVEVDGPARHRSPRPGRDRRRAASPGRSRAPNCASPRTRPSSCPSCRGAC